MKEPEYLHMYEEEVLHWWYAGMRSISRSILPPSLLPPNPVVLDAGCGTGYNIGWLQKHYSALVTGVDFSSRALNFCRCRGSYNLVQADIASLPIAGNSYDLVICFDVLTHLKDYSARCRALQEFLRVLKPGGRLLLRVPAYQFLRSGHDDEVMAFHRYRMRELHRDAAFAGFEVQRLTGANTILFPVAVFWRVLKKMGIAPEGSDVRSTTRGKNWLNGVLASVLECEAAILRHGRFGFGLSIFLLASKPDAE